MKQLIILTLKHRFYDIRLYYKIARSAVKDNNVTIITNRNANLEIPTIEESIKQVSLSCKNRLLYLYLAIVMIFKEKADYLICVEPITIIAGLFIRYLTHCRLYFDCHEFYEDASNESKPFLYSYIYNKLFRIALKRLDGIIVVNEAMKKELLSYNDNIVVCRNNPNKEIHKYDDATSYEYDFLYSGGISLTRGILLIINGLYQLKKKGKHLSLLIIGSYHSDTEKKQISQYILDYSMQTQITIIEDLSPDTVSGYLQKARICLCLLNPLTERYQKAIPLKLLEYLLCGKTVIMNRFPILDEYTDLQACIPIKYSIDELIRVMLETSSFTEEDLKNRGVEAHNFICKAHTWDNEEMKLRDFIHE